MNKRQQLIGIFSPIMYPRVVTFNTQPKRSGPLLHPWKAFTALQLCFEKFLYHQRVPFLSETKQGYYGGKIKEKHTVILFPQVLKDEKLVKIWSSTFFKTIY